VQDLGKSSSSEEENNMVELGEQVKLVKQMAMATEERPESRFNYASNDCGAKILSSSPDSQVSCALLFYIYF